MNRTGEFLVAGEACKHSGEDLVSVSAVPPLGVGKGVGGEVKEGYIECRTLGGGGGGCICVCVCVGGGGGGGACIVCFSPALIFISIANLQQTTKITKK